jgi:hypothetical protein
MITFEAVFPLSLISRAYDYGPHGPPSRSTPQLVHDHLEFTSCELQEDCVLTKLMKRLLTSLRMSRRFGGSNELDVALPNVLERTTDIAGFARVASWKA